MKNVAQRASSFSVSFQAWLTRVRAAMKQAVPDQAEVDSLAVVKDQMTIPQWFQQNTRLCYRWYAESSSKSGMSQCSSRDF